MPLARAWRNVVGTLLLALPLPTVSAGLELGRVIHVVDGDTLDVLMADKRTLGTARRRGTARLVMPTKARRWFFERRARDVARDDNVSRRYCYRARLHRLVDPLPGLLPAQLVDGAGVIVATRPSEYSPPR
jgi:hypothetical protein